MLTPSVWRGRASRTTVLWLYGLGAMCGGATTALVLVLVAGVLAPVPYVAAASVALFVGGLGVLRELKVIKVNLPEAARLVPREVFRRKYLGPVQFGFEMGTGVRTYVSSTAPYVLALTLALCSPGSILILLAGIGFGLGRSVMLPARIWSGDRSHWNRSLPYRMRWVSLTATVLAGSLALARIITS